LVNSKLSIRLINSFIKNIPVVLMALLSFVALPAYAQDSSETAKIQYLIASVDALEGARFIRNGREHDTRAASNHLRLKLKAASDKVRTAEDFIHLCASQSSLSGEPYLIKLADGSTVKSEIFFKDKLKTFTVNKP
jgi:hypothetical protein